MKSNFGFEHPRKTLLTRAFIIVASCCLSVEWTTTPLLPGAVSMVESKETNPQVLAEGVGRVALRRWNETGPGKEIWNYERGVLLVGLQRLWQLQSGEGVDGAEKYLAFIQRKTDQFVQDNGTIATYNLTEYTLDNILPGRNALFLWKQTGLEKYAKAAALLRSQLRSHPRTKEGGFWHKAIYPYQMWLDGLYMAEPFYAEYAATFDEPDDFDDIARQFLLTETHLRDPGTGLYYHGYDESRAQNWSDPVTGDSPSFWGRADGWLAMGLVDTLDYFPLHHPQRDALVSMLERLIVAIAKVQDPNSAVWWEVLDRRNQAGNYLESSASAMFLYVIRKAARLGYISGSYYQDVVTKGYEGFTCQFVTPGDRTGEFNITRTVSVGGLGGNPYRNGTYEYYLSEAVVTNDAKGIGPFLMASVEIST